MIEQIERGLGEFAPMGGAADLSDSQRAWLNKYQRTSVSPGTAIAIIRNAMELDVRHVLNAVTAPTLVISHSAVAFPVARGVVSEESSRYIAERIGGATLVCLPGRNLAGYLFDDVAAVVEEIARFLTGATGGSEQDRKLATILYTDIVSSTERAGELGDSRWKHVLDEVDRITHQLLERYRGQLIKSLGDGHLAIFDAPGRAIRCAFAMRDSVERLDIGLRAGLHTGEVELRGPDIGGLAATIGRRVCDLASRGDVLVSASVPALVAGSGITFESTGTHVFKGVPGDWELFAVKNI